MRSCAIFERSIGFVKHHPIYFNVILIVRMECIHNVAKTINRALAISFLCGMGFFMGTPSAFGLLFVPDGAVVSTGGGMFDLACTEVQIGSASAPAGSAELDTPSGQLRNVTSFMQNASGLTNAGSALYEINADWINFGTFNAQSSTVQFSDYCGVTQSKVNGNTTFSTLKMSSSAGHTYTFESGTTFTISKRIEIVGSGAPVMVLAATASQPGAINLLLGGTQSIQNVGVNGVKSTGQWLASNDDNRIANGYAPRWFKSGAPIEKIPVLSTPNLLLLILILAALMCCIPLRRNPPKTNAKTN